MVGHKNLVYDRIENFIVYLFVLLPSKETTKTNRMKMSQQKEYLKDTNKSIST